MPNDQSRKMENCAQMARKMLADCTANKTGTKNSASLDEDMINRGRHQKRNIIVTHNLTRYFESFRSSIGSLHMLYNSSFATSSRKRNKRQRQESLHELRTTIIKASSLHLCLRRQLINIIVMSMSFNF